MRKYWKLLIISLLAAVTFSFPSYADEPAVEPERFFPTGLDEMPEPIPDPYAKQIEPYGLSREYTETELFLELESRFKEALLAGEPDVDVSDMGLDVLKYKVYRTVYYSPYLSNGIDLSLYYNAYTGKYTRIEFKNPMSIQETREYFLSIDSNVREILNQVSDDMDTETKALVIHDYFGYEYEYDTLPVNEIPEDSFRSGGIIRRKIGVCQAYAYAYAYIMNRLGIECYVAGSDAMNHAWNIINVDGEYYHVDCTWDDTIWNQLGMVSHEFFLLSDWNIQYGKAEAHYGWDLTNLKCESTKYDDYYWSDIVSQIIFNNGYKYYIKDTGAGSICSLGPDGKESKLKDLGVWLIWGTGQRYAGSFSGLFLYNEELYYNTAAEIRKMSLNGENDQSVHVPDTTEGYVYGSRRYGSRAEYRISQSPDTAGGVKYHIDLPFKITPDQILLSESRIKIKAGQSQSVGASLVPTGAVSQITWRSSNPNVAEVDEEGTVTGRELGTAVITAETDNGKTAECQIAVTDEKYKVTYDANGGTPAVSTQELDIGSVYGSMPVPVRQGYQFAGWYTSSNSGRKVTETEQVRQRDHTLYAHWTANTYKIRYHRNGAVSGSMADTVNCKYGDEYTLRKNTYKRTGYTFAGWANSPGGVVVYKNQALVGNMTNKNGGVKILYAKWTPVKYKITYKLNSGKNNKKNPSSYKITSSSITLKSPSRKGFAFKGWYSDSRFKKKVTSIKKGSTGNKTLYAKWSVKKYKITYKLNGGRNHKKNPKTYKVTSSTITLRNPSRSGYTFKGWYSDSKYKKKISKIKKGSTGNKVLYAKWKRK